MAIIKKVRGFEPKIGENCFLADNAVVVGDVTMGKDCSIWFNAVLRGDVNTITIGNPAVHVPADNPVCQTSRGNPQECACKHVGRIMHAVVHP